MKSSTFYNLQKWRIFSHTSTEESGKNKNKIYFSYWAWSTPWGQFLSLRTFCRNPVLSWAIRCSVFQPVKFHTSFEFVCGNPFSTFWHLMVKFDKLMILRPFPKRSFSLSVKQTNHFFWLVITFLCCLGAFMYLHLLGLWKTINLQNLHCAVLPVAFINTVSVYNAASFSEIILDDNKMKITGLHITVS